MAELNDALQEKIDLYISDNMTEVEKTAFEKQITTDKDLYEKIKNNALLASILPLIARGEITDDYLKSLRIYKETYASHKQEIGNKKNIRTIIYTSIAAAACIIFFILIYHPFSNTASTPATLYAENFHPLSDYITKDIRGNGTEKTVVDSVMKIYNAGNYKAFLLQWHVLTQRKATYTLSEQTRINTMQVYAGIAALAVDDIPTAKTLLITISPSDLYYDQAQWYSALMYLKENNITEAKKILGGIVKNKTYNAHEAQILLKKLD